MAHAVELAAVAVPVVEDFLRCLSGVASATTCLMMKFAVRIVYQ